MHNTVSNHNYDVNCILCCPISSFMVVNAVYVVLNQFHVIKVLTRVTGLLLVNK